MPESTATKGEPGAAEPEWRDGSVLSAAHTTTTRHGGGDAGTRHSVSLMLEDWTRGQRVEFEFPLGTASEVAELRRFLGVFDFPLLDDRDLDAACERMVGGRCTMLAVLAPGDDPGRNVERVLRLAGDPEMRVEPDTRDGQNIWNHDLHWRKRKEEESEHGGIS